MSCVLHSIRTLEEHLGRSSDALISAEMGGLNSLIPIIAAAACGLPVIDGDGMRRAFPELQMTSFSVNGISASPFVMTDEHLNTVICHSKDDKKGEAIARAVCTGMGLFFHVGRLPDDRTRGKASRHTRYGHPGPRTWQGHREREEPARSPG